MCAREGERFLWVGHSISLAALIVLAAVVVVGDQCLQSTCSLAFFPHLLTYSAELWVSVGALRCSGLLQSLPIALMVLLCHSLAWDRVLLRCLALLSLGRCGPGTLAGDAQEPYLAACIIFTIGFFPV